MIMAFFIISMNTTQLRHMVILYGNYGNYHVGIVAMVRQYGNYSGNKGVHLNSVRPAPHTRSRMAYLRHYAITYGLFA